MTWQGIHGHDAIVQQFRSSLQCGRLASTFLFVGPAGIGKRSFAIKLAQALLCEAHDERLLDPCGHCPACQQVLSGTHPDLDVVSKPPDKSRIPVELFIGDREHRGREGLCHRIALKPSRGKRKVAIIDDADFLNPEGANCLLKTLEEPPPRCLIILIGTRQQRQLPTIRSRCQVVRFQPLPDETLTPLLVEAGIAEDEQHACQLTRLAQGSLSSAAEVADAAVRDFRGQFLRQLASAEWEPLVLARDLSAFVDAAGKEPARRRARLRLVCEYAAEFYRQMMRADSGADACGDDLLRSCVATAREQQHLSTENTVACLQRCLDAMVQVEANANQATLIECWLDDLSRGGPCDSR